MGVFRRRVKKLVERLTGCEIERFGDKSFLLIDKKRRTDAWFSRTGQIRSIVDKFEIDLVIDVGANEGQFARDLRSFYRGKILSFEPVSSAFEKLATAANSDPNWHVHKLALGSRESTQAINVSTSTVFSSLLKTNDYCARRFGREALGTGNEVVSIRRLDKLLYDIAPDFESRRIFLKLDTQGYDTEVFKGLGNKLECVVALQSEVSLIPIYEGMPHWTESIATYERAGFAVVGMFPVTQDSDRVIEYDCLMIRVES
ncbi:MAG TPA: FkbM family methyltransferase [Burkholderiales bacterium]